MEINRPLITVKNVTKIFNHNGKRIDGLKNINFQVNNGEIVSIIGPSGCGKTTILKMICNIIKPTNGYIHFQGKEISNAIKNNLIGYIPQNPTLLPNRTVTQNINLPLEIKKKQNAEKVKKIINLVGLSEFEDAFPHQLSGGMRQRVSLARALVYEPQILLMDEPFSSLDEIIKEKLQLLVLDIYAKLKQTILFVTHSIEEAVFISNRLIFMAKPSNGNGITDVIDISLPKERNPDIKLTKEFFNYLNEARKTLKKVAK